MSVDNLYMRGGMGRLGPIYNYLFSWEFYCGVLFIFFSVVNLFFSFCQFLFLLEMIDERLDSVIPMPDLLLFFILLETFL